MGRNLLSAVALSSAVISPLFTSDSLAESYNLPELGDASSAVVSPQQEYELGQTWLRLYRSRVPTSSDPLLHTYIEQLLGRLAQSSQLNDRRLELIVVKNPTMNAFAVPGGVVGVHTGLFLYAESEAQLASVLSHELAHLSQRHFARGVEMQQKNSIPMMAAMLASLVLAATAGGDAGIAALTATQAAALDSQLRFSRQNEQEADRIGMQTMVAAGEDPYAVPAMFERMLKATRYSRRPPEFLLTHPVTESRIADALNRANKYPRQQYPVDLDFYLMRARIQLQHDQTPQDSVKRFSSELSGESLSAEASRYGLVLALTEASQLDRARATLQPLLQSHPDKDAYIIAEANIYAAEHNYEKAQALLEQQLSQNPDHHAYNVRYAELLMKSGNYARSEEVLEKHVRRRPKDDSVWYLLAEVHGLAGNILGVHEARAEYFILNGVFDKAQIQLRNALKLSRGSYHKTALLEEKLKQVAKMQSDSNL
ncbi:M48 family metallopeptidase [Aestuariicella hydrocarbonica]|uniref:Putative beta-barrel assembly-enhancing protease n=1 Tax=Pseudomaricurvus hydrocarbonicus TaxID=1470433 RepID=A0A9E5JPB9_9GAMM|nr:M48 family metalloprotease [Aestuariicella hydrocarbonica]NHO64122.1 M48 family metallopeptidase [Aestuariicella hydrocarbonica]